MPHDSYRIPEAPNFGRPKPWHTARYWDDDGQWNCKHKHPTEAEAMECGRQFADAVRAFRADPEGREAAQRYLTQRDREAADHWQEVMQRGLAAYVTERERVRAVPKRTTPRSEEDV